MDFVIKSFTIDTEAAKTLAAYAKSAGVPQSMVVRQLIAYAQKQGLFEGGLFEGGLFKE